MVAQISKLHSMVTQVSKLH